MSAIIPNSIRDNIRTLVYNLADEFGYMQKSRTENALLMEQLISNPDVGGLLKDYISKETIKTYIKDAVLNRYSKERNRQTIPLQREGLIKAAFKVDSLEVEANRGKTISFHRDTSKSKSYIVVAVGTYVKWETALKKALEYMAKCPCLDDKESCCCILLLLATSGRSLPQSDKAHLQKSLLFARAKAHFTV